MNTIDENYTANLRRPFSSLEIWSHDPLLSKIGDELRWLYSDVMDSDQPSDLLDLAGRVDELIAGRRCGGA